MFKISDQALSDGKPLTKEEASARVETWKAEGLKVGFTNGCFDIIHPGHIFQLEAARARCDRLILGLNADRSVRELKGPTRPVNDEISRARVLAALSCVDAVVLFAEETPEELIKLLTPNLLVKGNDYTIDQVVGADYVLASGGEVYLAPLQEGHSTTSIIQRAST